MYIVNCKHGNFGPFRNMKAAEKWVKATEPQVGGTFAIRVLFEPLPWSVLHTALAMNGPITTPASSTEQTSAPTRAQK